MPLKMEQTPGDSDVNLGPKPRQLEGPGDYLIPNCGYICGFQLFVSSFSIGTGHSYNDMQTK